MSDHTGALQRVAWSEVFPWLMILRAVPLSTSVPILFVATIGTLLMPLGWRAAEQTLSESERSAPSRIDYTLPDTFAISDAQAGGMTAPRFPTPAGWREWADPMLDVPSRGLLPLSCLFRADITWSRFVYFALGSLWNLLVWAFFGGIITRVAVVKFGRLEREGLVDAGRFVARRFHAFFGAPLFPLCGVLGVIAVSFPVGLLLRSDIGILIASLVWIFVLIGGAVITFLFVGLLVGWPLMWGASSTETMGDVFEATQRSYSYALGRPAHYAFYALVWLVAGSVAFVVVEFIAQLVVYFSYWAVSWGAGAEWMQSITNADSSVSSWGRMIVLCLNSLVMIIAHAFRFSFFWCAAGAAYLLLRRDSDQIEFDDVVVEEQQRRYSLPPLVTDEAGVPGVKDPGS